MLPAPTPPRKSSRRPRFLEPLWDDDHPAFRRIDATLPADHPARWMAAVVARLDLAALRGSYAGRGCDAYPVELVLALVLFLYDQGILCPAEWARRARWDDQAKWLLRGLQPSRSQLYAFRDRVAPFLDGWHKQLIAWAVAEGVTTAARGSLDGSFVAALASRHQLHSASCVDRRLLLLQLLVWLDDHPSAADPDTRLAGLPALALALAGLWLWLLRQGVAAGPLAAVLWGLLAVGHLLSPHGEAPRRPAWVPHSAAGRKRVLTRYEHAQKRLAQKSSPLRAKKKLSKKDQQALTRLKVSVTDADAALGWDKVGTFRPLYNLLLVQATDAPLALAWEVLPFNHDQGTLKPLMEKVKQQLGHPLKEALVDGAFVTAGEAAWCEQQGITLYAPPSPPQADPLPQPAKDAANAPQEQAKGKATKPQQLPKGQFRYVASEQAYYCPQGKRLPQVRQDTETRKNGLELTVLVHQASGQDCQGCPKQPQCTGNPHKGRVVKRYQGEEALERLEERMKEPDSQRVYRQRKQSVELGYADLKEHRGLRVFRCFSLKRARVQAGLVLLASNGLRILRELQRRQSARPGPAPPEKQPA